MTRFLLVVPGSGVGNIAKAKAGIMKEGRPVVLAAQPDPEAQAVLVQHAAQLQCPVIQADEAVTTSQHGIRFLRNGLLQQHFDLAINQRLGAGLDWSAGAFLSCTTCTLATCIV